jgi:hypothetical protein
MKLRLTHVARLVLALTLCVTFVTLVATAGAEPNDDLVNPNIRLWDNFWPAPPNPGVPIVAGDTACAPNSNLNASSTIHVAERVSGVAFPVTGSSVSGNLTWDLTATIGAQVNSSVNTFWPLNDNGAPMDSSGLKTGAVQSFTGHFAIDTDFDTTPDISGTLSGGSNPANWGVCRNFDAEPTESPNLGGNVTGDFYIVNAGVLTYTVTDGPIELKNETGDATAYFMNSFSTTDGCPPGSCETRAGHFRAEFGTTILGGAVQQMDPGPGVAPVTVEPLPDVTVKFADVSSPGGTNVVKTTDAPELPGSFQLDGGFFYEIFTTAGYTSPITICLPIASLPGGVTPQILHYEGGAWVQVVTTVDGDLACGDVTSLSPFALGYDAGQTLSELSPVHAWLGLKNSDDQGTQFDLKAELLNNGSVVASGLTRCITSVTRDPSKALGVSVNWDPFTPATIDPDDVLSIRLSARIGTTPTGTKCAGPGGSHSSAAGLRLYYDSTGRASGFDMTVDSSNTNEYLHRNGAFDATTPTSVTPATKDAGTVNFTKGNTFAVIGTWNAS